MKQIVLAMLMFTLASLQAEVIDFEGATAGRPSGQPATFESTTGNTYNVSNKGKTWWLSKTYQSGKNRPHASDYLVSHTSITISIADEGTTFDLYSFDMAEEFQRNDATVKVSGVFANSSDDKSSKTFTTELLNTQVIDWSGLTSVTFTITKGVFTLDNLVLSAPRASATPEPASYYLIVLGLCGLIGFGRRQRLSHQ